MKKLITTGLLGAVLGITTMQVSANELTFRSGSVEVIALSSQQAAELREERVLYEAMLSRVMNQEDQAGMEQRLQAIQLEYQNRIDAIIEGPGSSSVPVRHQKPGRIIY